MEIKSKLFLIVIAMGLMAAVAVLFNEIEAGKSEGGSMGDFIAFTGIDSSNKSDQESSTTSAVLGIEQENNVPQAEIDSNSKIDQESPAIPATLETGQENSVSKESKEWYAITTKILKAHNFEQWNTSDRNDLAEMLKIAANGGDADLGNRSVRVSATYEDLLKAAGRQ